MLYDKKTSRLYPGAVVLGSPAVFTCSLGIRSYSSLHFLDFSPWQLT